MTRRVWVLLAVVALVCAASVVSTALPGGRRWVDQPPVVLGGAYLRPAQAVGAAALGTWACWIAAVLARPRDRHATVTKRVGRALVGVLALAVAVAASLCAAVVGFGGYSVYPLSPRSDAGCRVVVRTQPWMAAAHGDYLVQRPGADRREPSGVTWELLQGGPSLPYDEYRAVRWDGERATVSTPATDTEPGTSHHVDCGPR